MNLARKYLLLPVLFLSLSNAQAEDVLTVGNVTLPQNGEVALEINGTFDTNFTQFQLEIELPADLTLKQNQNNSRPWAEKGDQSTDHTISSSTPAENTYRFVCSSMSQETLPSGGVLMRVKIQPVGELQINRVLQGSVKNILFNENTGGGNVGHNFADIPFSVTIGEPIDPRTILDENSTTPPTASNGPVDVRVIRTINANRWNTICLPFAMDVDQTKAAFGDDVQLGDFQGIETETDPANDERIIGISVKFATVNAMEANHPYIIRVSERITSFTADDVVIDPEDASVDCDELILGSGKPKDPYRYLYNSFVGTYEANTKVPKFCLFLQGNNFWYSYGDVTMKGYRAYFDFYDVLTEVEEAAVRMVVDFDGEETGIDDINANVNANVNKGAIYDLSGRKLERTPQKGVYIVGGKKVIK